MAIKPQRSAKPELKPFRIVRQAKAPEPSHTSCPCSPNPSHSPLLTPLVRVLNKPTSLPESPKSFQGHKAPLEKNVEMKTGLLELEEILPMQPNLTRSPR